MRNGRITRRKKGPLARAIFVAKGRCNFCHAQVLASKFETTANSRRQIPIKKCQRFRGRAFKLQVGTLTSPRHKSYQNLGR